MSVADNLQNITWTAPDGTPFVLKTPKSGYQQKHIGEVKENSRTSYSSGSSSSGKKQKGATTSRHSSVSTSSSKKQVRDSNDTFTDMGVGGKDVSLDCYFIGDRHYIEAETFRNALCQVGKSKLQLAYGDEFTVNVLSFEVKNTLTEKINSTIVTVNFHQTAASTYPKSQQSKKKEIKNKISDVKDNLSATVETTAGAIPTPSRLAAFSAKFQNILTKVSTALDTANNVTLNSIMADIGGQNLLKNSGTIASQLGVIFSKSAALIRKVKNPASYTLSGYSNFFSGWNELISSLKTNSLRSTTTKELSPEQRDELILNDAIASSAIISAAEGLIDSDFETREEATEAAQDLVDLSDDWFDFADEQGERITDLNDAYIRNGDVEDIVNKTANEILEQAFKLKVEQQIELTEDKNPIELTYQYYKDDFYNDPDSALEYFIKTNNLTENEYFLIPRGRKIKIYV